MQRRERADLARAGLIRKPASAGLENSLLLFEKRLRRRAAQAYQDVRIGELDLAPDERQTNRRIPAAWACGFPVGAME